MDVANLRHEDGIPESLPQVVIDYFSPTLKMCKSNNEKAINNIDPSFSRHIDVYESREYHNSVSDVIELLTWKLSACKVKCTKLGWDRIISPQENSRDLSLK